MPVTNASANGKPQRKQLADQLDRLDSIIDCLADALPGAVRDAVAESLTSAVKQLVADALADPAAIALIRQTFAPAPAPVPAPAPEPVAQATPKSGPSFMERLRARVRTAATRTAEVCASAWATVRAKFTSLKQSAARRLSGLKAVAGAARMAWQLRGILGVALGAGAVVAAGSCLSHTLAVVTATAGAVVASAAAQVVARLCPWAWRSGQ